MADFRLEDLVDKRINSYTLIKGLASIILGFVISVIFNPLFTKTGIECVSNYLFGDRSRKGEFIEFYRQCIHFWSNGALTAERVFLLSIVFGFVVAHIVFGVKRTFSFVFKYRWIFGAIALVVLTIGKYNGNPFDCYIGVQTGYGSEYENPVIGFETPERSDEVLVNSAVKLYNMSNGLPGEKITAASVIQNPSLIITDVLLHTVGRDYAYSFDWYFYIVLVFLVSIEFFLLITNGKRLLSVVATCMIYMSTFYLWWGLPGNLLNTMGIPFAFYNCLHTDGKYKRGAFGLLTAWFSTRFVFSLYPAWQVPLGYALVVLMIWAFIDNFEKIKSFDKRDWIIIVSCIMIMIVFMAICYYDRKQYISTITSTVYPGERREYGSYATQKLFNYIPCSIFWLKRPEHMCEYSMVINLFPVPMLLAAYYTIKSKKKDILLIGLCIVSMFLILFCSNGGLSKSIADLTLISHSTSWRAIDIVGYIQVIIFARVIALYKCGKENKSKKEQRINCIIALCLSAALAVYSIHMAKYSLTGYMTQGYIVISFVLLILVFYLCFSNNSYKKYLLLMFVLFGVSIFTGFIIRPIRKGTDIIYSKPIADQIEDIKDKDEDAVWITYGSIVTQSYVKCFGVDVVNYVNTTPNMELWTSLDPLGTYNEVYNRYAHVVVDFSDEDTWFELRQADAFNLHIAYRDLYKTNAKYLLSQSELDIDNEYIRLDEIYSEAGYYIYSINYY